MFIFVVIKFFNKHFGSSDWKNMQAIKCCLEWHFKIIKDYCVAVEVESHLCFFHGGELQQ